MSESESGKSSDENESWKHQKTKKELKSLTQKELIHYIQKLQKFMKKRAKRMLKYRHKVKDLLKELEEYKRESKGSLPLATPAPTLPTSPGDAADELPSQILPGEERTEEELAASAAFDFVAEIRQVAEQAQNLNGFVYEPTSGMYYDQKSGYYYNAEYGLYYDGNTGCYYSYNQKKASYEFHSQVHVQPNQNATKAASDDDHSDDDDDDDEVAFDENGGVITDKARLQQIKLEKKLKLSRKKARTKSSKAMKRKPTGTALQATAKSCTSNGDQPDSGGRRKHQRDKEHKRRKKQDACDDDVEDGELSSSNSSSQRSHSSCASHADTDSDVPLFKGGSRFQDIAKKYPPSLRIIVQETNLEELKVGSLSLITFKGGTVGREGDHDVLIPDPNVSKCHLKFHYDTKKSVYKCIDLGSQNGTVLNGTRMSASKTESIAHDLVHGSVLQINQTKLLCHVHEGNSTCGLCEPGLLIAPTCEAPVATAPVVLSHKEQLKKLQKRYGLENEKFVEGNKLIGSSYNDRAATRRIQVGSSSDKEKTQVASVDTAITSENKGFKMLSKLGWNKGDKLGKSNANEGLLEPVNVSGNVGTTGLGCDEYKPAPLTAAEKKKIETWKKAQARYQQSTDIFSTDLN